MAPHRLICPRPPSPILPGGYNSNGRSPPPRAPKWLFNYYSRANVGRPPPYEEWLQRAICQDQEAARLLPPEQPYWGPFLHEARARTDCAYRDWKAAIDDLWADKYEVLLVTMNDQAVLGIPSCALDCL